MISQEQLKIVVKLLMTANRKSYMLCRLACVSMAEWANTLSEPQYLLGLG